MHLISTNLTRILLGICSFSSLKLEFPAHSLQTHEFTFSCQKQNIEMVGVCSHGGMLTNSEVRYCQFLKTFQKYLIRSQEVNVNDLSLSSCRHFEVQTMSTINKSISVNNYQIFQTILFQVSNKRIFKNSTRKFYQKTANYRFFHFLIT